MQIHVVQPGQSLYGIAQAYGTSVQSITKANELMDPSRIVIGQALLIPIVGKYHWVQKGQSLYLISKMYGIPVNELANFNNISITSVLNVGKRLYIPTQPKTSIDVLLYIEPRTVTQTILNDVQNRMKSVTYLAVFSYRANRDGSLDEPITGNITNLAKLSGVINTLVVSNLEEYQFSADLAHTLFIDEKASTNLFDNVIKVARKIGYKDIHFDFELLRDGDRGLYNNFLQKARTRLHAVGLTLSTAIGPKSSDVKTGIYGAHDFASHGKIVDFTSLMTYEWGYMYSNPQAISPIEPVRKVVQHALSVIPRNKIFLGQNLYGYDWTAPYPPSGGTPAKAISPKKAIEIATRENAQIHYDYSAQAPYFRYIDDLGKEHEVWFEDARSIQAKFDLIKQYKLRGIMYWKQGLDFPQNWLLLTDNFIIRKRG